MSYSRSYEPEPEEERSELDIAYDTICDIKELADYKEAIAASCIKKLEAALHEALEYFLERYDVRDGPNGEQLPNEEMRLGQMIDETLHGIRF